MNQIKPGIYPRQFYSIASELIYIVSIFAQQITIPNTIKTQNFLDKIFEFSTIYYYI